MSFNLRYGTAADGANQWEQRKPLVLERIRAFNPHLLGLQECRDDAQAAYVRHHLSDYQFISVRREAASEHGLEMAPVLYQLAAFAEVEHGHFWLSETPAVVGSKSWGSMFPRTASWVTLRHHASGQTLTFINTHFDYYSEAARTESAKLLGRWVAEHSASQAVIITGDFNADKNSPAYTHLTHDNAVYDVYRRLHAAGADEGTYHAYGQIPDPWPIDWILASERFEVVTAEIDRSRAGELYPSDHYPLTATLRWRVKDD